MNDVQPPTLNDPVRTRKATIGISVGIGDARSRQCTELVGYTLNSRTHKLYSTNPCFYSPRGFPTRR